MRHEIRNYEELRKQLAFEAEDEYRVFAMKGIPSKRPFVGVRIPIVRRMIERIPKGCYETFLKVEPVAIEEVLARGMIICKLSYEGIMTWFDSQITYIDNWCTCDIFCASLRKEIRKHQEEFFEQKVETLLEAENEFAVRVGLVMMKVSYVEDGWLGVIFDRVERLRECNDYYVRMAIAWLVSECFIKYPEATLEYLKVSRLPKWTYNKAISKICDSYRVDEDMKKILRVMRK